MTIRDDAYARLGVKESDVALQPQITPQLRMIVKTLRRAGQPKRIRRVRHVNAGVDSTDQVESRVIVDEEHATPYGPGTDLVTSWPHYLHVSDAEDARKVLTAYYSIGSTWRKLLPIEAFCLASGVGTVRVLSIIAASCVMAGAQPAIVQKTIEIALTDEGDHARDTLHKASGFLPAPKSAQTNITVQQNASATAAAAALPAPSPDATIRTLADAFNVRRGLPPATITVQESAPAAPVRDTVPVNAEFESDEDDE